jgi:hypothetical protein
MVSAIHFNTPSAPDSASAPAQQRPKSNQSESTVTPDRVTLGSQAQQTQAADVDHEGKQR